MESKYAIHQNLVLVGMMGSGKTSVGRRLAETLSLDFVDIDHELEAISQLSIPAIFASYGESEFRALESRVLARVLEEKPKVVSTGGGAFLSEGNRNVIKEFGISIWLDADLDTLWDRVKSKTHRPLLLQENPKQVLNDLLELRNPIYALADHRVRSLAHQSHMEMVENICHTLGIRISV